MIRFIMLKDEKGISGAESQNWYTIDAEVPELEAALTRGGYAEDRWEIHKMVGAEVKDKP